MKIQAIKKLCRERKAIYAAVDGYGQRWIGTAAALYAAKGLEKFGKNELFVLFDIPEKERESFGFFEHAETPEYSVNLTDTELRNDTLIRFGGTDYVMLTCNGRTFFLDRDLLKPLDGEDNVQYSVNLRQQYPQIIARRALNVLAVMSPTLFKAENKIVESVKLAWEELRRAPSDEEKEGGDE